MATLNKDLVKLGIAPIGWTNDICLSLARKAFQQTISEMSCGLQGSEVGGHYPTDRRLKKALTFVTWSSATSGSPPSCLQSPEEVRKVRQTV